MVCVPCFIVPVLLLIFRFIIQPILSKFWYTGKNDGQENKQPPELVKECKDGVCTLAWKKSDQSKKSEPTKTD